MFLRYSNSLLKWIILFNTQIVIEKNRDRQIKEARARN